MTRQQDSALWLSYYKSAPSRIMGAKRAVPAPATGSALAVQTSLTQVPSPRSAPLDLQIHVGSVAWKVSEWAAGGYEAPCWEPGTQARRWQNPGLTDQRSSRGDTEQGAARQGGHRGGRRTGCGARSAGDQEGTTQTGG